MATSELLEALLKIYIEGEDERFFAVQPAASALVLVSTICREQLLTSTSPSSRVFSHHERRHVESAVWQRRIRLRIGTE